MRYAQITPFEVCNGKGAGVSLFTQGCHFHCIGCFNQDAWDFNGGKEWTEEVEEKFFELIGRPYIKRVTILGGEPLVNVNVSDVLALVKRIKAKYPDKKIWIYTAYKWEHIFNPDYINISNGDKVVEDRMSLVRLCDVLVDGRFVEALKDLTLKFRGSSNQRIIDVKKSLEANEVVLYDV